MSNIAGAILSVPISGAISGAIGGGGFAAEAWLLRVTSLEKLFQKCMPDFVCPSFKEGLFMAVPVGVAGMQSQAITLIDKGTVNLQQSHTKAFKVAVLILEFVTLYAVFQHTKKLGYHNISERFFTFMAIQGYSNAISNVFKSQPASRD